MLKALQHLALSLAAVSIIASATHAQDKPVVTAPAPAQPQAQPGPIRSLSEFGPLNNQANVKAAYEKAFQELSKGGVLLVPSSAMGMYSPENTSQTSMRSPAAPAETKRWANHGGPGITIVEIAENGAYIKTPAIKGVHIERTLRMPLLESLPHWTTDAALNITSNLIHGSNSYMDQLVEPVSKGLDVRFYVKTIRGLRAGQFVNIHGGPWYEGGVTRGCVKTLGYDPEKALFYFTADTSIDHKVGALIQNKNNEGVIWMEQNANCDEQTYDVMLNRKQYALGDTYMFFARFKYMSNIHSSQGDENGNIFGAYSEHETNNFTGSVQTVDWKQNTLVFDGKSAKNVDTLGTSRQLINLNPSKWITAGKLIVVPAESYWENTDTGKFPFEGKTYPSTLGKGGLRMGGLIRGDKDCPWDQSIVGRWIGISEPSERIMGRNAPTDKLRWYQIDGLKINPDGTKDITIQRFWWGAKSMGSPTLYRQENYSWDGHLRPLPYVIAPGTYVTDVGRAIPAPGQGSQRTLGLAPYPQMNTPLDFAAGDPVEQAIGPDPFKPLPFRIWMWDGVPSAFPTPILDLNNAGADSRYAAMWVRGGPGNLDNLQKTARQKPSWENVIVLDSAADVGLNWKADFANAAILFQQPNRDQPIKWLYGPRQVGKPIAEAALTVSKDNGDLTFKGGDARFSGSVVATGLSGDKSPAKNLRGKNIPVKAGATQVEITFPNPETDGDYALMIEQTWFSNRAITTQTDKGFTVSFEKPAPENAKLHWVLVR
jgi:hypothetical protein